MTPADRAKEMASRARASERRDWWLILTPGATEPTAVLFVPPLLQSEVLTFCGGHYSHCGVTPLLEQVE